MNNNWIIPDWPVPQGIKAASTLRTGGVSLEAYASWNLAAHVGDEPAQVAINRQRLRQQLRLPSEPIWLNQVHSNQVVLASAETAGVSADASYSAQAEVVCAVMTADCLPLLLCAEDGSQVAAVHCGWRSLLAGVIEQTCLAMKLWSGLAWLGPAIGPQAFVVGNEVRQLFITKNQAYASAFIKRDQQRWLADIYQLARLDLAAVGIQQIYGGDYCTYSQNQDFFSYRRQGQTGRMATLIWRQA